MRAHRFFLGCCASCILSTSLAAPPSAKPLATDIAPQPLEQALAAFGEQTGLQLFYVAAVAKAHQSKGAPAGLAPAEALDALLKDTGLKFEFVNERAVRIFAAQDTSLVPLYPRAPEQHTSARSEGAPPTLEEVLVTANRRLEQANKVPINMAILSQDDMQASGVKGIEQISALTPSVRFDMTPDVGPGAVTYLSIRGVSDRNTPMTGLYLDDTPIPAGRGYTYYRSFPFTFDLDRVEVLRGPQLQLFADGNQGGAVRFIYNQASLSTSTALAQSEVATTERGSVSYEAGGAFGGPVVPDFLGFRVSAWRRSDGGFVDRVDPFTGVTVDGNANHWTSTSLRGALTIAPSQDVQISPTFIYASYDLHDSPFFFGYLSNVAAGQLRNGMLLRQPYDDTFYLGSLKITARLEAVDLSAVTSYFHAHGAVMTENTNAYDWGSVLGAGYPIAYSDAVGVQLGARQATFMQELRVASVDTKAAFTWDAGAFYSTETVRETDHFTAAQGLPGVLLGPVDFEDGDVSSQSRFGAFGELSFGIAKHLTLSAGMHVEYTRYNAFTSSPAGFAPVPPSAGSDSAVLPRLRLSYQANDRELIYFTATRGYGSGGLWALICLGGAPAPLATDTLWSYEVGTKSGLFDGRVQLDTGVFHITWDNQGQGYPPPLTSSCNYAYLGNPGPAASNGFDVSAHALVGAHVNAAAALAYTDVHYSRTLIENGAVVVREGEAVGSLPHVVSPWNITASLEYVTALRHEITATFRAEDIFRSRNPGPFIDNFFQPSSRPDPTTNVANLRATLRWGSYDVALFLNNALDTQPTILRNNVAFAGSPVVATTLRPRTVGVSASWRY